MAYGYPAASAYSLEGRYIVWSPASNLPPTTLYNSRQDAIKVAHLMATKHKGQKFAVCKIVGDAQADQVKYNSYED